jgi:hypothetical protein
MLMDADQCRMMRTYLEIWNLGQVLENLLPHVLLCPPQRSIPWDPGRRRAMAVRALVAPAAKTGRRRHALLLAGEMAGGG